MLPVPAILMICIWLMTGPCEDTVAHAQQVQTLPSQQNVPLPQATPPPFTHQPGGESIPPMIPGPQGNTREIPLPEVFRGCWSGSVERVDSIVPLGSSSRHLIWLTKSYTLCYKQAGYSGRWKLTFAEGSVSDRRQVTDQHQLIKVKSVSAADRAELTAYLHFRAPEITSFGMRTGVINTLDELTHLYCEVMPGGNEMEVRASVFVENDDQPNASIMWHTRFVRTVAGSS
jgi:hypothetical protein